jgi:hypothetical protein
MYYVLENEILRNIDENKIAFVKNAMPPHLYKTK